MTRISKQHSYGLLSVCDVRLHLFIELSLNVDCTSMKYSFKGGDPAAPSGTATLLRLHPPHPPHLRRLPHEVGPATSGADDSGGVTGGVYKARERIHRGMLIRDYEQLRLHAGGLQPAIRTRDGFEGFAHARALAARCAAHCSTCAAQGIKGMMT